MDHKVEQADLEPIFEGRNGWRRIYFDLPGMGRSAAKASLRAQDDMLEAVLAFIDHVVPDGRFVLAGTSGGAYLARAVAVKRRARVAGLLLRMPAVIADTTKRTLPPQQPLVRNSALMASLDPDERLRLADALVQSPSYLEAFGRRRRTLVEPAIEAASPLVVEMRADPARYGFSFDLPAMEKTFSEPTLIITGRQDPVVGYRDAWDILESYPRASFVVLDRADHGWPIERPDLLAALVDDWLARIVLGES
ncbi:MAG: alpha/beta hydrolase [Enhydrobacter sp.]|nr:MAG: alpha/beta hydrolase [Enhydrobacter sp.]